MKPFKIVYDGLILTTNDFPSGADDTGSLAGRPFLKGFLNFHTISSGCMLHVLRKMVQQRLSMTKHLRGGFYRSFAAINNFILISKHELASSLLIKRFVLWLFQY